MQRQAAALLLLLLAFASVCAATDLKKPAAPLRGASGSRGLGVSACFAHVRAPQFWVNQKELQAAPERWRSGFARLRASLTGEGAGAGRASRLAGAWTKVETVGQEEAMLMLGLNVVFRKAANLLSKVVIRAEPTVFEVTTKGALVVSIKERYNFNGEFAKNNRRDKRWGKHTGKVASASESKVVLDITWADPHGGHLTETFEVDKTGNKMTQTSKILVNEDATTGKKPKGEFTYYCVYKRAD
eukprot:CAMPEP_0173387996 /NCGR_PEP_ID=MMETSP1356-20130122/10398_1 /TAXON_ID=77927 ORGANISM="Hemiselmis virescens, Strain PCC157" /NCGR_SAMPLE_ID=MMETSP1356 /ASSEMBLY_ACC=CAM_ASM_000847 /LENGTH=242 /DNA_ID=CAMNT_0014344777 /DNA_START=117 /DNA_END=845 /DNA_ORIENTATION=+